MKHNFECNNSNCMAFMTTKNCCIWGYEDEVNVADPKVCPVIQEILRVKPKVQED